MTKWPVHNQTQNNTKTRRTPRPNRHLEKKLFSFFITETLEIDFLSFRP